MSNTYNWVISSLECYPHLDGKQDVVFAIHWRRQATDGIHMADVYGLEGVTLDPDAPFTPFDGLTKAQVESWLEKAMNAERIAELDAALDTQIEHKINPLIVTPPLPWA